MSGSHHTGRLRRRTTAAAVFGLSLAITLAGTALAVTDQQASPRRGIDARSSTAPVVRPAQALPGQSTRVSGRLPTRVARPVVLQVRVAGTWSRAAKGRSTRRGTYRFDVPAPMQAGSVRWRVKAPRTVVRVDGRRKRLKAFTSAAATSTVVKPAAPPTPTETPTPSPTPTPTPTPTETPAPDTTPPAAPADLVATPGDGAITLTWDRVTADDLAGYVVLSADGLEGPWSSASGDDPLEETTWTASGLANGSAYFFAVVATDTTGNRSDRSPVASAMPVAPDTQAPDAPTGLLASAGDGSATLAWDPVVAEDLDGYTVHQATSPAGPWTRVSGSSPLQGLSWVSTSLTNSATYYFAVSATDHVGNESPRSQTVSVTPENATGPSHCGMITRDEVWSAGTVHVLDCTVQVAAGATLTLRPGAGVQSASAGIVVEGTLRIDGTAEAPVVLQSLSESHTWAGVRAMAGGRVVASEVEVRRAPMAWTVDAGAYAELDDARVRNAYYGVVLEGAGRATLRGLDVAGSTVGVHVGLGGTATIERSTFSGGSTGVETASTSSVSVVDSRFVGMKVGVSPGGVSTTIERNTFEAVTEAAVLVTTAEPFDPVRIIAGNTATGSAVNGVWMQNPVFADGARLFGGPGWALVISNYGPTVNVPAGSTVTLPPGAVVKLRNEAASSGSWNGTLNVAGRLTAPGDGSRAALTTYTDDTLGGDANGETGDARYGHFYGITVHDGGSVDLRDTVVNGAVRTLDVEGGGRATLDGTEVRGCTSGVHAMPGAVVTVTDSAFSQCTGALDVAEGASAVVTGTSFVGGQTAVTTQPTSDVAITGSTFSGMRVGVTPGSSRTRIEHNTFEGLTEAAVLVTTTAPFDPVNLIVGNTATSSTVNGVWMQNTVFADGARLFGRSGWGLVLSNYQWRHTTPTVNVPAGSTLVVPAGAVVKFRYRDDFPYGAWQGLLRVDGTVIGEGVAGDRAVLTQFADDSHGGDVDGDSPDIGWGSHFQGIVVQDGGRVELRHTAMRYATFGLTVEGGGTVDLESSDISHCDYVGVDVQPGADLTLNGGSIRQCRTGVAAADGGSARITGTTFGGGQTGVNASLGSRVVVLDSAFEDLQTGVWLADRATVVARSRFDRIRQDTIRLDGVQLNDAFIENGNVATNSYVNGIILRDPVFADGTVLYSRPTWALVITNTQYVTNVPEGVTVTVPPGTVVKSMGTVPIGISGDLSIAGTETDPVVFTSWHDDVVGGATDGLEFDAPPQPGDWAGLSFDSAYEWRTVGFAVFRYARTAIAIGHLSAMTVVDSVFAYNQAAFTVASTDDVAGAYADLACLPPYTGFVTGGGNFYGVTGLPGFPFDPGTFAGLLLDGKYKMLYEDAAAMYGGSASLEVPVGGNTIPWAMYECLDFPVFPVTPVITSPAAAPRFPELAEVPPL